MTETWGTLPELVAVADAEALASSLAGVAAALARAAEAAAIAIALFMFAWIEDMGALLAGEVEMVQAKKNLLDGELLWISGYPKRKWRFK